jgi:adenylylsulfate kinase
MVKLFLDAGIIALTAFISPYKADREKIRSLLGDGQFFEVFVDCPIEVCEKRDQKGIYKKAKTGEIKNFTGISAPYERPDNPELIVESNKEDALESAGRIFKLLMEKGII